MDSEIGPRDAVASVATKVGWVLFSGKTSLAAVFLALAVLRVLLPLPCSGAADGMDKDAVVHITVFTSHDCPQCRYVENVYLPELQRRYGSSLKVRYIDMDEDDNYDLLVRLENQFDDTDNDSPIIFCGEKVFGGRDEAERGLEKTIRNYLRASGAQPVELRGPPEEESRRAEKSLHIAYFHQAGCRKCSRVEKMLAAFQRKIPGLTIARFDLSMAENKKLAEAMGHLCGLSEDRRLVAPSLFIGRDALVGDEIREAGLRAIVERYQVTGTEPIWEEAARDTAKAAQGIIRRFQTLGILTVLAAGLIDGVNPCAFATIIFLVSYLAFVGRQRREVLMAGLAFTVAVFLTYFAVGLGLFQFLQRLTFLNRLSHIVYALAAALVFVLGAVSLYDYRLIRKGRKPSEMKLQLPLFLKRRIHDTIRKHSRSRNLVLGAFTIGAVVSVLELACTGQVYLPTIVFVAGISGLRTRALLYLFFYNLLFVLPLVLIFLVSYMGATSQQLGAAIESHMGRVKLILGLFFLLLGGLLTFILLT